MVFLASQLAKDAPFDLAIVILDVAEGERPQARPQSHQADEHAKVADAVDDERLVGRVARALALEVKTDEEVRADAHQLPEHKDHREVAGDHDSQHAEAEQREILKKAVE